MTVSLRFWWWVFDAAEAVAERAMRHIPEMVAAIADLDAELDARRCACQAQDRGAAQADVTYSRQEWGEFWSRPRRLDD